MTATATPPRRRLRRSPLRVILLVLGLLVVAAVGRVISGAGEGGTPITMGEVIRRAAEQPSRPYEGRTTDTEVDVDSGGRRVTAGSFDELYSTYRDFIGAMVGDIQQYWSQTLPQQFQTPYRGPSGGVVAYNPRDPSTAPACGNALAAPPGNAFYCPASDVIAFDEPNLMFRVYVETGDAAAATILAHEWGHLIQDRLGITGTTFQREIQADCFAGAWMQWMGTQGRIEEGDLDEVTKQLYDVADTRPTRWEENDGHGNAAERTGSFATGYRGGVRACTSG